MPPRYQPAANRTQSVSTERLPALPYGTRLSAVCASAFIAASLGVTGRTELAGRLR